MSEAKAYLVFFRYQCFGQALPPEKWGLERVKSIGAEWAV
jgi:hypothetical protein